MSALADGSTDREQNSQFANHILTADSSKPARIRPIQQQIPPGGQGKDKRPVLAAFEGFPESMNRKMEAGSTLP
jgi:hypothetical protein